MKGNYMSYIDELNNQKNKMICHIDAQSEKFLELLTNPKFRNPNSLSIKPRIYLGAKINARGNLEVYWARKYDAQEHPLQKSYLKNTDFLDVCTMWETSEAPAETIFMFREGDYIHQVSQSALGVFSAEEINTQKELVLALESKLLTFLTEVARVAGVTMLSWPAYSKDMKIHVVNLDTQQVVSSSAFDC